MSDKQEMQPNMMGHQFIAGTSVYDANGERIGYISQHSHGIRSGLDGVLLLHRGRFFPRDTYVPLSQLLPHEQEWKESQLDDWLAEHLPKLGTKPRKLIKDSLAIAAYHTQTSCPLVELLICDDAPQFDWLTAELALCWVHEHRHYKKLTPCLPYHRQLLDHFQEHFWKLYRQLLAYRHHPNQKEADSLQGAFERLFGEASDYE
jgi:hypothetical protein